jgi:WD40 repeat protein
LTLFSSSFFCFFFQTDKNIKAWDLSTYRVVQTVIDLTLYRPTNFLGAIIHDPGTLSRGGTRPPRLVTASNRLCVWPIKRMANDRAGVSHTSPICGVAYSSEFKQVISGDNEGTVQVWDVENGTMTFKFNRTHGHDNKLTNLCLDPSGRRIVTCGDDGLAKIWNFSNGQCLR